MVLPDEQNRWRSITGLLPSEPILSIPSKDVADKTILITGAGGSIGTKLGREVGRLAPRHMVLLDASEQSLYRLSVDREVTSPHSLVVGSTCDGDMLNDLMERHRPAIIFHAAAFKHVPLMEFNPFAAIENNAGGTFTLAQCAERYRVEQLVMVSTDKAVEPASIMGASKRVAELILLAMRSNGTQFKAVRLGNVLASEGSVLPFFQSQIERGEPLSVTHSEASRYFLTLEYAAQLLLLALSDDMPAGILVPELGEPIRIEEIARRMLTDAGLSQRMRFTGLRPGDKLAEKLIAGDEEFLSEAGATLRAIQSPSLSLDELKNAMKSLEDAVQKRELPLLIDVVSKLVPSYQLSEVIQSALHERTAARCDR
jgi:FlaA1/EpsC-like NDP-sugar epimerase